MKKIVVFSAVLLFFACKKDEFQNSIDGLTSISLPSELIGNWRYLYTQGGWGNTIRDSTIIGNVPMGADTLIWLTVEGQTMSARVESNEHFTPGEKVKIRFRMNLASMFDEATTNRI